MQRHADACVTGRVSPNTFEDWLIGATWNVEHDNPDAADVTHDIKLLLTEHSHGDLSDSDLRAELRQRLEPSPTPIAS